MNCEEIRELISSYIDNELTKEEKIDFESHIKGCKDCYEEYLSILEVVNRINSIEEQPLPSDFKQELRSKLDEQAGPKKKQGKNAHPFKFRKWTSIAAILLVGIVITAALTGQYSPFHFNKFSMNSEASTEEGAIEPDYDLGITSGRSSAPGAGSDGATDMEGEFIESDEDKAVDDTAQQMTLSSMQDKIIYSASLTLQVNNHDKVYQDIVDYTENVGGFIQHSYTSNPQYQLYNENNRTLREGYLNLRVPSSKFDETIATISEMGNITESQRNGENITSQYRDLEVEVNNLEIQEERIVEIMKKADQVEDILEIERELNRIRTEINRRKTTLKNWDQLVNYSTIEVSIREEKFSTVNVQGGPFKELGSKIQKGFIQSINLIVEGAAKLIIFISQATPFIIILIVLYFIYRRWVKELLIKRIKK